MLMQMYAVFDRKAGVYSQPFFQLNEKCAVRIMDNCVKDTNHQYGRNPEDFELWLLADYDDNTGAIKRKMEKVLDILTLVHTSDTSDTQKNIFTTNENGLPTTAELQKQAN